MSGEIVPIRHDAEVVTWTREQRELLKRTVAANLTDDEFALFQEQCVTRRLNPFTHQIHAIKRQGSVTFQTGIDGYRLIAQRTGLYAGQTAPEWCGEDGVWRDVWLAKGPPAAAKVGVLKVGMVTPVIGIARWDEFVPKAEKERFMWERMPAHMLAKVAEAQAIRKAFPEEVSGLYVDEEMAQAGPATPAPRPVPQIKGPPSQATPRNPDDYLRGDAVEALRTRAREVGGLDDYLAKIQGRSIIPKVTGAKLEALIQLRKAQNEATQAGLDEALLDVADPTETEQIWQLARAITEMTEQADPLDASTK